MAGFPNSINGFWAHLDIDVGDYISFLYGARSRNLYRVDRKVALRNAENLPPWDPITFKSSGKTYYFPFRLYLRPERRLDESIVKPEFSYVAEDLLLRGGYRKTHFQADTVTFYNASSMGEPYNHTPDRLNLEEKEYTPKIVFKRKYQEIPEKYLFREQILQSLVKRRIRDTILREALERLEIKDPPDQFEILGEKALPQGFIDIFIKLRHPKGRNKYILVEVKMNRASQADVQQLKKYLDEFKGETTGGVLIARSFSSNVEQSKYILLAKYTLNGINEDGEYTYDQLIDKMEIELV